MSHASSIARMITNKYGAALPLVTAGVASAGVTTIVWGYNNNNDNNNTDTNNTYNHTASGFRRQFTFWSRVLPVVADYYLQTAESSPYVKYQKFKASSSLYDNNNEVEENNEKLLQSLHEKHAPEILQVMLDLKGLYIKLGQLLSVTSLPIPEPYRVVFRTLQNNVPGHEEFDSIVRPTLEEEFQTTDLKKIFEFIDPIPCGAASIGQAHRAVLTEGKDENRKRSRKQVIIKVQYSDAIWKVPADIQCVGDFLQMCVWFGVVDEQSSQMSFDEFSRQFLAELDYRQEMENLQIIHASSLDPSAPYIKNNVIVPEVYEELCTNKVLTMSYLPGPTMESEARRQLELLGIDTSRSIDQVIKDATEDLVSSCSLEYGEQNSHKSNEKITRLVTKSLTSVGDIEQSSNVNNANEKKLNDIHQVKSSLPTSSSWKASISRHLTKFIKMDTLLWTARFTKKLILWSQASLVKTIQIFPNSLTFSAWNEWAESHATAAQQAERLNEIESWCNALFDVHGHQIFGDTGLFNADPHPGNILIVQDDEQEARDHEGACSRRNKNVSTTALGLIDYGQCKKLTNEEQLKIARLILSVANNESDRNIASCFRDMEIITSNDSTEFLGEFGRLLFGPFKPEHMQRSWHEKLHKLDKVLYFPNELSMVYRTSMLLRGLALSLQMNLSVSEQWKHHAQSVMDRSQQ